MNRDKLKQLVAGIESIEKQIAELSKSKRDLLKENAGEFDPKAVRKVIARRKIEAADRDNEDFLVASYEVALGMAGNLAKEAASGALTYDEAAEAAGVSRRTMARQIARVREAPKATDNGTDTIDPATGEVIESSGQPCSRPVEAAAGANASRPLDTQSTESSGQPDRGLDGDGTAASRPLDTASLNREVDLVGGDAGNRSEQSNPAAQAVNADPPLSTSVVVIETAKECTPAPNSDGMDIPTFLKRRAA